jgi:hypothetical protein
VIYRNVVLVAALALSACGMDSQGGYQPMNQQTGSATGGSYSSPDAKAYQQAHDECWESSMSLLGGNAMDATRERTYNQCMNARGWEHPMMPAKPQPTTTPGSR